MVLSVASLRKQFGDATVLEDVSFRIGPREKVALVGRNGTGKTTLLKILAGELEPDGGSVSFARGARVGYLRQELPVDHGLTVLEEAQAGRAEALSMAERLKELEARLADGATPDDLEEYATLHERFLEAQGYAAENDVRLVLARMGFDESEFDKPTSALSGGEKTRLALARLLLEEPDLVILDEPTNHLDLQATEWLESWIRGYPGAVLLVSHDRAFLSEVAQQFVLLEDGRAKTYPGPLEKFLRLREEEAERLARLAKKQAEEIARLDEYVRRFMGGERTAQARGRLKMLERLKAQAVQAPRAERGMKASLKAAKRSADVVLEAKGLAKSFGEQRLFHGLDWVVRRGDRWGVIGQNGAGKSTLVKILLGQESPDAGWVRLGANVEPGWFAQEATDLDPDMTPIEYLVDACGLPVEHARGLLGRFLFSGDDALRKIGLLSGGEKNKLALARLTAESPNLLVLDEPTNHLDFDSREALAKALAETTGTLILVSHDRHLLDSVTDHTLDLRVDGHTLYPGRYAEYRLARARAEAETQRGPRPEPRSGGEDRPWNPRALSKEVSRLEKELAAAEDRVAELERELAALESTLADPPAGADLLDLTSRHGGLQDEIARALAYWEQIGSELERLRAMQGGTR